jgi:hypothetical protein
MIMNWEMKTMMEMRMRRMATATAKTYDGEDFFGMFGAGDHIRICERPIFLHPAVVLNLNAGIIVIRRSIRFQREILITRYNTTT